MLSFWQLGFRSINVFVNKHTKHCEEKINKDELFQSSGEADAETNSGPRICQVYNCVWSYVEMCLTPPGRKQNHQGGLQGGGVVGADRSWWGFDDRIYVKSWDLTQCLVHSRYLVCIPRLLPPVTVLDKCRIKVRCHASSWASSISAASLLLISGPKDSVAFSLREIF